VAVQFVAGLDIRDVQPDDGMPSACTVSTSASERKEEAAGLMISASALSRASCIPSTSTPSW
jgi:hypothetical protein